MRSSSLSSSSTTGSIAGTLFSKVVLLLSAALGTAALGTFVGAGITSVWAMIVLGVLMFAGSLGLAAVAEKIDPAFGFVLYEAWAFITGMFIGPVVNTYAHILGADTVMFAFVGTGGVMVACGAITMLTNINFGAMGRILMFALFALIIVGVIGIFVHFSPLVNMLYAGIGMAVFAGFFLVDFWMVKQDHDSDSWGAATIMSMSLFLDFVNFFLYLLQFLAGMKDNDD